MLSLQIFCKSTVIQKVKKLFKKIFCLKQKFLQRTTKTRVTCSCALLRSLTSSPVVFPLNVLYQPHASSLSHCRTFALAVSGTRPLLSELSLWPTLLCQIVIQMSPSSKPFIENVKSTSTVLSSWLSIYLMVPMLLTCSVVL